MDTQPKKLYRSTTNRMVGGVCAGIGDYLNMDPTVIRLLFLLLIFVTGGTALILYLAMLVIVPETPGSRYSAPAAPATPVTPASPTTAADDEVIPPPAM